MKTTITLEVDSEDIPVLLYLCAHPFDAVFQQRDSLRLQRDWDYIGVGELLKLQMEMNQ